VVDRQAVRTEANQSVAVFCKQPLHRLRGKQHLDPQIKRRPLLLGVDQHSVQTGHPFITHTFNAQFPELLLKVDESPWKIHCTPVAGVDRDFFGQPIGPDKILPGPFQGLRKGKNTLALWQVNAPAELPK